MRLFRALAPALIATVLLVLPPLGPPRATAAPEGTLTWGVHVTLAPTWFDPAETPGMITPFMVLYAIHDAMVKPMPGQPQAGLRQKSAEGGERGGGLGRRRVPGGLPLQPPEHRQQRALLAAQAWAAQRQAAGRARRLGAQGREQPLEDVDRGGGVGLPED